MPKEKKAPQQQKKRPKGAGAEQPAPKRSTRAKKPAAKATELAGPTAQRCGRDDCLVCKPKACNKCSACKASPKPTAGQCKEAQKLRQQPCPNVEKARPKHARDPRNNDESSELYRASREIIERAESLWIIWISWEQRLIAKMFCKPMNAILFRILLCKPISILPREYFNLKHIFQG